MRRQKEKIVKGSGVSQVLGVLGLSNFGKALEAAERFGNFASSRMSAFSEADIQNAGNAKKRTSGVTRHPSDITFFVTTEGKQEAARQQRLARKRSKQNLGASGGKGSGEALRLQSRDKGMVLASVSVPKESIGVRGGDVYRDSSTKIVASDEAFSKLRNLLKRTNWQQNNKELTAAVERIFYAKARQNGGVTAGEIKAVADAVRSGDLKRIEKAIAKAAPIERGIWHLNFELDDPAYIRTAEPSGIVRKVPREATIDQMQTMLGYAAKLHTQKGPSARQLGITPLTDPLSLARAEASKKGAMWAEKGRLQRGQELGDLAKPNARGNA